MNTLLFHLKYKIIHTHGIKITKKVKATKISHNNSVHAISGVLLSHTAIHVCTDVHVSKNFNVYAIIGVC